MSNQGLKSPSQVMPIYWIEDEPHLFQHTLNQLQILGCPVQSIENASRALSQLDSIRENPGPIVLDLWLPDEDDPCLPHEVHGPDLGLWLLKTLQQELGTEQMFFVVSGNLSVDVIHELHELGVPDSTVFAKPLVDADSFVEAIVQQIAS